jgi:riboflavin synthase
MASRPWLAQRPMRARCAWNDVAKNRFGVNLIPHTLEVTTLGACQSGTQANLEVDIIARYLERMRAVGDDA